MTQTHSIIYHQILKLLSKAHYFWSKAAETGQGILHVLPMFSHRATYLSVFLVALHVLGYLMPVTIQNQQLFEHWLKTCFENFRRFFFIFNCIICITINYQTGAWKSQMECTCLVKFFVLVDLLLFYSSILWLILLEKCDIV